MLRRERAIRRIVADLGLEITSFRTDGGSRWKVDIRAPNGRQRPFVFSTRESGNYHHERNEVATLRRWRREVCPELDTAEESGTLQPPEAMKSTLAKKLEELNIPLRREEEPVVSRFVRPPEKTEPVSAFAPGTPEAALEQSLKQPTKEQPMSAQTAPINHSANGSTEPRKPRVLHKKREQMSFGEVMKFGAWMNKERLDGYYVRGDFLDHASHALGFKVSEDALRQWMESNGVQMPQRPNAPKVWHDQANEDIAAIALALADLVPSAYRPGANHKDAMLAIVERRTKA